MWPNPGSPHYQPLSNPSVHHTSNMFYASPSLSDHVSPSTSPMLNDKSRYHDATHSRTNNQSKQSMVQDHSSATFPTSRRAIESLQRWNNILGYLLGIFSVGLTIVMEGTMVYVLVKFYQTRDIPAPGRTSPWAKDTTLWPTILLLIASLLTFLVEVGAMLAACCRKQKVEDRIAWVGRIVKVATWVAVFILYRIGKTSRDLWGWSCDDRAAAIQQSYITNLDFHALCTKQTYAWYMSIAETVLSVLLMLAAFIFSIKLRSVQSKR